MEFELDGSLKEWVKDKPLSILQLDPADRAVLRIAGECQLSFLVSVFISRLRTYILEFFAVYVSPSAFRFLIEKYIVYKYALREACCSFKNEKRNEAFCYYMHERNETACTVVLSVFVDQLQNGHH